MSKLTKNNAPANKILKSVVLAAALVELLLYLFFFPIEQKTITNQSQETTLPHPSFSISNTIKEIGRDSLFIAQNRDLLDRKNILTDLYSIQYFHKEKSINEPDMPEPTYTVVTQKTTIVTAYSSTPDQTDSSPFITAMGSRVRDGVVAANWLKFGTKVRLPQVYGDKIFVVEDRMASFNRHKLDVWMETRNEALEFGAKRLTVQVVEAIN